MGYWSFAGGSEGAFEDARGEGPTIKAYDLYENQALLRPSDTVAGPNGTPDSALYFDGDNDFAFLDHDPAFSVTQGTIAMWVRWVFIRFKRSIMRNEVSQASGSALCIVDRFFGYPMPKILANVVGDVVFAQLERHVFDVVATRKECIAEVPVNA